MSQPDDHWGGLIEQLGPLRDARCVLLSPVFNDYACARALIQALDRLLPPAMRAETLLLLVDDGSTDRIQLDPPAPGGIQARVLQLRANLGHQRAIAVGLGFVSRWVLPDATVAVLDSDGEDRPEDLVRLIEASRWSPDSIVVANRAQRSESRGFRLGYVFYRLLYRMLTGQEIRNGNFSAMSGRIAARLAYAPSLWNHFAATIYKSRKEVTGIEVRRGVRYDGSSRMNFVGLVAHGLSAVAVHMEAVGVRMLVASLMTTLVALAAGATVVAIRLFTDLAIPGWASILSMLFLILAMLGLVSSTGLVFSVLAARERRPVIAAIDTAYFVEDLVAPEAPVPQAVPRPLRAAK